jgi:enoyl-CoA hydratase
VNGVTTETTDDKGQVHCRIEGAVAHVVFDRPQARNAMTWHMYSQLADICRALAGNRSVRVVQFRGAGGQAFVAGTDIEQFKTFKTAEDALAYEERISEVMGTLEGLPMPTVAVLEGWAVGGGLAIATACDFRIARSDTRMGVPIARTLGNCLAMPNLARLERAFGHQRVKRMLLLAQFVGADEALACGYLESVCEADALEASAQALCERLCSLAPVTQSAMKTGLQRLVTSQLPDGDDLVVRCYTSQDFHEGVRAFVEKRPPQWQGL